MRDVEDEEHWNYAVMDWACLEVQIVVIRVKEERYYALAYVVRCLACARRRRCAVSYRVVWRNDSKLRRRADPLN